MTMFVCLHECKTVWAAALVLGLGQLCFPRRWSLGQVEPSDEQGRGTDFRGRHHLLQRWWVAAGVVVAWPASPGRGLGEEGHRSNQLPASPGQARAFPEPAGGRARLELPSRASPLALDRPRRGWGGPTGVAAGREEEEEEGDDQSLSDPASACTRESRRCGNIDPPVAPPSWQLLKHRAVFACTAGA